MDVRLFIFALAVLAVCGLLIDGVQRLSPLARAAQAGDLDEIDRAIGAGDDLDEASGIQGWPPLLHAIHGGRTEAARRLLDAGATLDRRLAQQALSIASGHGDAASVRLLLDHGAVPSRLGTTPVQLMGAAVAGSRDRDYEWSGCDRHTAVVRLLVTYDADLKRAAPDLARWIAGRRGCAELVGLLR